MAAKPGGMGGKRSGGAKPKKKPREASEEAVKKR